MNHKIINGAAVPAFIPRLISGLMLFLFNTLHTIQCSIRSAKPLFFPFR